MTRSRAGPQPRGYAPYPFACRIKACDVAAAPGVRLCRAHWPERGRVVNDDAVPVRDFIAKPLAGRLFDPDRIAA